MAHVLYTEGRPLDAGTGSQACTMHVLHRSRRLLYSIVQQTAGRTHLYIQTISAHVQRMCVTYV